MIESWGRGIEKITNSCKSAGKSEPIFEFKRNCEFSVTFDTINIAKDTVKDTVKDTIKDTANGVQGKMLALLSENPRMTAKKISLELGINERNVKKNIKALKDAGLVKRVGAAKGGYWVVKMGF